MGQKARFPCAARRLSVDRFADLDGDRGGGSRWCKREAPIGEAAQRTVGNLPAGIGAVFANSGPVEPANGVLHPAFSSTQPERAHAFRRAWRYPREALGLAALASYCG